MVTALRTQNQVYIIDQVVQMLAGAMLLVGATTCYQDLNIAMYPSIGQKSLNVIHTKPDEKLGPFQKAVFPRKAQQGEAYSHSTFMIGCRLGSASTTSPHRICNQSSNLLTILNVSSLGTH